MSNGPVEQRLAVVPGLDELEANPALAMALPRSLLVELTRRAARLSADLQTVLIGACEPQRGATEPERVLDIEDAAKVLGMTKDFVYRNWKKLNLGYRDDDGRLKFPTSALQRHIQRKARQ